MTSPYRLLKLFGCTSTEAINICKYTTYDYRQININQLGGTKQYYFKYKNKKYKFTRTKDDTRIIYCLRKNERDCILFIIEKDYSYAYLETVANEIGCLIDGIVVSKGGNKLMVIAIGFLKSIKDKYKLKHIMLTDKSHKIVNKEKLNLQNLLFFTKGKFNFYHKFGFVPCNNVLENNLKLTNYDVILLDKLYVKLKEINKDKLIEHINGKYIDRYKNLTIQDFIIKILSKKLKNINSIMKILRNELDIKLPTTLCMKI